MESFLNALRPVVALVVGLVVGSCGSAAETRQDGGRTESIVVLAPPILGMHGSITRNGRVALGAAVASDTQLSSPPLQSRGFVGFDVSSIPRDADVDSAVLRVEQTQVGGLPFLEDGGVVVDLIDGGDDLSAGDYSSGPLMSLVDPLSSDAELGMRSLEVRVAVQRALDLGLQSCMFRLMLRPPASSAPTFLDRVSFHTANEFGFDAAPPELEIEYVR